MARDCPVKIGMARLSFREIPHPLACRPGRNYRCPSSTVFGPARRHHGVAPRLPRASGTALRRAPDRGVGGRQAQELRLRRGGDRDRQDRRGRRDPRPQAGERRDQDHRSARRHGCAADHGSHQPAVQVDDTRQDARLRPRRPHRDAARRGALSRRDAEFRRHRGGDLPAGGGGRRRRQGDDPGRHDGAVRDRRSLRHAQLSGPRRSASSRSGPARSWRRPTI